jgi:predicted CXXCH cytochrome family protein
MVVALALPGAALAQSLADSPHDFRTGGNNPSDPGTGIYKFSPTLCAACHAPHNPSDAGNGAPLWNHAVTSATYTVYSSGSLDATPEGTASNMNPQSRLCLSCHDGTVNIDAFGGAAGANAIDTDGDLTTDLSNDHPVALDYTTAGSGLQASPTLPLTGGTDVDCATCHNVHDWTGGDATNKRFLRMTAASICQDCHDK